MAHLPESVRDAWTHRNGPIVLTTVDDRSMPNAIYADDNKAFQIKGELSYHKSGPIFEHMKTWNPDKHPGHAAAALTVSEVYSGAEKLL